MLYETQGETKHTPLFAGTEVTPLTTGATIAAGGGALKAGAVLGMATDSGKYAIVDSTKSDGSEKPLLVLSHDADATEEDVSAVCYKCGVFAREALSFGGTDTADTHEAALRLLNIHMRESY